MILICFNSTCRNRINRITNNKLRETKQNPVSLKCWKCLIICYYYYLLSDFYHFYTILSDGCHYRPSSTIIISVMHGFQAIADAPAFLIDKPFFVFVIYLCAYTNAYFPIRTLIYYEIVSKFCYIIFKGHWKENLIPPWDWT